MKVADAIKVGSQLTLRWEIILDHLGRSCITPVLKCRKRGKRQGQSEEHKKTQCAFAGFEDGGEGTIEKNVGGLQKLEKQGIDSFPWLPEKKAALLPLPFQPSETHAEILSHDKIALSKTLTLW